MNAHTLPCYVLGLVKNTGQPLQLVNAFEKPVASKTADGFLDYRAQRTPRTIEKNMGDQDRSSRSAIPDTDLDKFCTEIVAHVS